MEKRITLTLKELKRIKAIELSLNSQLTCQEAAQKLDISERQFHRLRQRYREGGAESLAHGNRGRPSPRRINAETRTVIGQLLESEYADYNSLHFLEILQSGYQIQISYSSLQNLRKELGYPTPKTKKPTKHRSRRAPKPVYGMMLQVDASIHPWLEDRGPKLALHAFIDDATNRVWAFFRYEEDCFGYLTVLREICLETGIPMSLYTDRRNVFQGNRKLSIEEQLAGQDNSSQFKRVLDLLGISLIKANSPQAKGRVERLFGTLQDRLVKALRKANASTLVDANQVLSAFLPDFNRAFMKKPAQEGSAFVQWNPDHAPDDFFCARFTRSVKMDNTISFNTAILQIPPNPFRQNFARASVELLQLPNGDIHVFHKQQLVASFVHNPEAYPLMERFVPLPHDPLILDFLPEPRQLLEYDLAMRP